MDDVREKLFELVGQVQDCGCDVTDVVKMNYVENNVLVDHLIANGVRLEEKQATSDKTSNWIPVTDRLPETETEVLILASRKLYSLTSHSHTMHHIITTGMYEDGTKRTEDSNWWWETDGFEYDEEWDDYIIPEGWWEYKHYNGDEQHNYTIDDEVTHWMPLPEPTKGE